MQHPTMQIATWYHSSNRHLYYIYDGKIITYVELWYDKMVAILSDRHSFQFLECHSLSNEQHFMAGKSISAKAIEKDQKILEEMLLIPYSCQGMHPKLAHAIKLAMTQREWRPLTELPPLENHQLISNLQNGAKNESKNILKNQNMQIVILIVVTVLWIIFLIAGFFIYLQYKKNQLHIPWIKL